jgi:hypothetical protein
MPGARACASSSMPEALADGQAPGLRKLRVGPVVAERSTSVFVAARCGPRRTSGTGQRGCAGSDRRHPDESSTVCLRRSSPAPALIVVELFVNLDVLATRSRNDRP